jgi:hypothetical protein
LFGPIIVVRTLAAKAKAPQEWGTRLPDSEYGALGFIVPTHFAVELRNEWGTEHSSPPAHHSVLQVSTFNAMSALPGGVELLLDPGGFAGADREY